MVRDLRHAFRLLHGSPGVTAVVLRQSPSVVAVGLVAGVATADGVSAFFGFRIADLLVGVTPTDPGTFVATAGLLFAAAVLACAWPARRASRIDPLLALT